MALTPKQKAFVAEYLVDLNATAAARRAGYSAKTADRIGPELLGKTCVSQAIQEAILDRQKRTEVTQDYVIEQLKAIADREASDAQNSELKVANKIKALELLGKHLGIFDRGGQTGDAPALDAFLRATKPSKEEVEALYAEEDG